MFAPRKIQQIIHDWWRLQYCKTRLPEYIRGELSPIVRERIGRYIDTSPICYAEYQRQRQFARDMGISMPVPTKSALPNFDSIWSMVQNFPETPRHTDKHYSFSYGLLTILVLIALLLPIIWRDSGKHLIVPPQPAPAILGQRLFLTGTPADLNTPRRADIRLTMTQTSREHASLLLLQNTPEPAMNDHN